MRLLNNLLLFTLLLTLSACGGGEREAGVEAATPDAFDATFADGLTGAAFQHYLHLRSALVGSDVGQAKASAANLAEALGAERSGLRDRATAVAEAGDLAAVRTAFAELTTALEPLFTDGLSEGVIYKQHCPMAFDGAGANWFSDAAEIRNPYYGDKMLKCGKVVAEIR